MSRTHRVHACYLGTFIADCVILPPYIYCTSLNTRCGFAGFEKSSGVVCIRGLSVSVVCLETSSRGERVLRTPVRTRLQCILT
jgi:hypothetical protein